MAKEQKQSIDLRPGKSFGVGLSNENLRIGASSAWEAKIAGTLDETRTQLDFEVGRDGEIQSIDRKKSIPKRIKEILNKHGIEDPNYGLNDEQLKRKGIGVRTYASFILQGSHDTMMEMAFGDQVISFNPNADNSHIERKENIENWAKDMYHFIADKYGEENIAAFIVHLDETTPHAHCVVVPINQQGKLSFKDVFAGKDKYEFSKRTKALWDEAAKISEKYGLARGDDKIVTGAKHKSYLQWMREQIFEKQMTIDEQDNTIRNQSETISRHGETISQQKKELYALNDEIKKANKKLKALTSMIINLENQKQEVLQNIERLRQAEIKGEITNEELTKRTQELNTMLEEIDAKIEDKKSKHEEATNQLRELSIAKHQLQNSYDDLQRQMNKEIPNLLDKTQHDINSTMWEENAPEIKKDYERMTQWLEENLTARQMDEFNSFMEGSALEDVAQRGEEIAGVAAALFLGYIDQATTFAQSSGGGGGGSSKGWGRKKDEDDEAFRKRCCFMGKHMMRPQGRKLKR